MAETKPMGEFLPGRPQEGLGYRSLQDGDQRPMHIHHEGLSRLRHVDGELFQERFKRINQSYYVE